MSHAINPRVVDISHHNVVTSFDDVRAAGILGVIHKSSQGAAMVDGQYAARRQAALDAGLMWGAYHFADGSDPVEQVRHFIEAAQPDANTLMCLDWEPNGNSTMGLDDARAFLTEFQQRMGRKAVLYSGNLAKEQLGDEADDFFGSHRLWLTQYGPVPRVQASWQSFWLWQFTGDGIGPTPHGIPGIETNGLDINSYDGSDDQLVSEWAS